MFARIRAARENESGFTLIELLIVIVILGVLAGIVVFSVSGITDRGTTAACKADKKTVEVAVEAYYAKTTPATYPATIQALITDGLIKSAPAAPVAYTFVPGPPASYTITPATCP